MRSGAVGGGAGGAGTGGSHGSSEVVGAEDVGVPWVERVGEAGGVAKGSKLSRLPRVRPGGRVDGSSMGVVVGICAVSGGGAVAAAVAVVVV